MIRIATIIMLVYVFMAQQSGCDQTPKTDKTAETNQTERAKMSTGAQEYIAAFQRGEDFKAPAKGVFVNGQPDEAALQVLGTELAVANPNVRENIVRLLVDMGRQSDPLTPAGADTVRHPKILALLAGPGLAKPDLGREAAMEALRKLAIQPDLAKFETEFTNTLAEKPTSEAFLLVAKAKTQKAKELVDRLVNLPEWQSSESARIAQAALGNTEKEDAYLAAVASAKDGKSLAAALGPLSLIGTQRSLKAIAERLRTPLTIEISGHMPGISEKSVRMNVLEALLYNFPDQPALYPNNINREEDLRAAENFCTQRLGVTYNMPAPAFFKYRNVPVPLTR